MKNVTQLGGIYCRPQGSCITALAASNTQATNAKLGSTNDCVTNIATSFALSLITTFASTRISKPLNKYLIS